MRSYFRLFSDHYYGVELLSTVMACVALAIWSFFKPDAPRKFKDREEIEAERKRKKG